MHERSVGRVRRRQVLVEPGAELAVRLAVPTRAAVGIDPAALGKGQRQLLCPREEPVVLAHADGAIALAVDEPEPADRAGRVLVLIVQIPHPAVQAVRADHVAAGQHREGLEGRVGEVVGRDPAGYIEEEVAAGALQVQQHGLARLRVQARVDVRRDVPKLRRVGEDPLLLADGLLVVEIKVHQLFWQIRRGWYVHLCLWLRLQLRLERYVNYPRRQSVAWATYFLTWRGRPQLTECSYGGCPIRNRLFRNRGQINRRDMSRLKATRRQHLRDSNDWLKSAGRRRRRRRWGIYRS